MCLLNICIYSDGIPHSLARSPSQSLSLARCFLSQCGFNYLCVLTLVHKNSMHQMVLKIQINIGKCSEGWRIPSFHDCRTLCCVVLYQSLQVADQCGNTLFWPTRATRHSQSLQLVDFCDDKTFVDLFGSLAHAMRLFRFVFSLNGDITNAWNISANKLKNVRNRVAECEYFNLSAMTKLRRTIL